MNDSTGADCQSTLACVRALGVEVEGGGTEFTIISTAIGYSVVWYCGRRLDAFPRVTLQGNLGYVAAVAVLTYALIAVILLRPQGLLGRVEERTV